MKKNEITTSGLICLGADSAGPSWGQSLDDAWAQALEINASASPIIALADYAGGNDPSADMPSKAVESDPIITNINGSMGKTPHPRGGTHDGGNEAVFALGAIERPGASISHAISFYKDMPAHAGVEQWSCLGNKLCSHGCVRTQPDVAAKFYELAEKHGEGNVGLRISF